MKKLLLTSATILIIGLGAFAQSDTFYKKWYLMESIPRPSFSQNLMYGVHGRYTHPIRKEKLNKVKFIRDFIPDYPTNWIMEYVSAEISATCNGKVMKAVSANDALTAEQINILNTVDLASEITIDIKYKSKNSATDNIDTRIINISVTVVPDVEAEFVGGYQQLKKYLKENLINKVMDSTPLEFQVGKVIFTVNEEGEIANAKISKSSGDPKTDKLFIEGINKMPKWKPAENPKGKKVKQEFEFSLNGFDGGC